VLRALLLSICLCAASSAVQAAQTYVCRIAENGRSGWIPEILFIGRDPGADEVIVSDPLILYYNDRAPVRGRVAEDNARRVTFVWSIRASTRAGQSVRRLQYTATWIKSAQRMLIAATPIGYDRQFSGEGTCNVEQR